MSAQSNAIHPPPIPAPVPVPRAPSPPVSGGYPVAQSGIVPTSRMGLIAPEGNAVDLSGVRADGTRLWSTLAYVMLGVVTLFTLGTIWLLFAMGAAADWFFRRRLRARILGSCLRVGPLQLPEVHQAASVIARRLGITDLPEIYVLETNTINAMIARIGGRKMVFLTDDAVDACLRSGDLRTLNFMLAHELAHEALGHTGLIRSYLRFVVPQLSRVDELSADAAAKAIVIDREIAASALIILLTGPQLLPFVNREAVIEQAMEVQRNRASKKAERNLHHPLLLRRLAHVYQA